MNNKPDLDKLGKEIAVVAKEYGLDFFDTFFQVLGYKEMNEIASYGGFPTRYPHWKFGMEYEYLQKGYAYGLQKIYEMVINNNPCYAYLLEANTLVDQKIVMAHVYGHCDFFKNNYWFSQTNRQMLDEMANHGTRIRRYIDKYGLDKIEGFIDICLSLEDLIDYHSPFIVRRKEYLPFHQEEEEDGKTVRKFQAKNYMNSYVNPKDYMDEQRRKLSKEKEKVRKIPESPEKDILLFLIQYAPLEKWELDVLSIIYEESYYFAPQGQTKIMNEGWATYWHSKIMTERILGDAEVVDYADHHSGTLGTRPGVLNPYKLGVELFRDIEERWNKGKFGKEYDECDDILKKKNWNTGFGKGREKIFEVRKIYNDVTFIDTFLTKEFCEEQKLFSFRYNRDSSNYEIAEREFAKVKNKLLFSLTNFGRPFIYVEDSNYHNRGELYLKHRHEGIDLKTDYMRDTLTNIQKIWRRPVNIETIIDEKKKLVTCDGKEIKEVFL